MSLKRMSEMRAGEYGVICAVEANNTVRQHFAKRGILCGTEVCCVGKAPFGDPVSYRIRDTVFALRRSDTANIQVEILT